MTSSAVSPRSAFPLWITGVCVAVVVYASLQPFTGWTALAPNTRFFLLQFGQRWIYSDAEFNFVAYLPLGFALAAGWPVRWRVHESLRPWASEAHTNRDRSS